MAPPLGRCDNHMDAMFTGGLIPKGPRCASPATSVMVYVETINPWDGKPNTVETSKLCDDCLAFAKEQVRWKRRARSKRHGSTEGSSWVRRVTVVPAAEVTAQHVVAMCRARKSVPRALRDHFGLDIDGRPKSAETERREASTTAFWNILSGSPQ